VEQQQALHGERYRYQPRDTVVRQHYQEHVQRAPAPSQRGQQEAPRETSRRQQETQRSSPPAPAQAASQPKSPAVQEQKQPPQQAPKSGREDVPHGKGKAHEKDHDPERK
jgi:hypothetical protein